MRKILFITLLMGIVIGLSLLPGHASLTPMAWGMPIMSGSASMTTFGKDTAAATDNQAAAVAFPGSSGLFGASMPTIAQTALQSQLLDSTRYANANQNYFFAYPYISIGGAPIPSMGLW